MEKRRSERKKANIEVEIIIGDTNYAGTAENMSDHGLYLETASANILNDSTCFVPGTDCEIRFNDHSGERINLNCKIAWSYRIAPEGIKVQIGMEIIFPPPIYLDFFNAVE